MAIKEGYVNPFFTKQIEAIDRLSQTLRDKLIQAVINKRFKAVKVDAKKLLSEIIDKL